MNLERLTDHAGEWLRGTGPQSDIVVSSRVRLARNLAGYPFVNRAAMRQRLEVLQRSRQQILEGKIADDMIWVDLNECQPMDRQLLVERHLISRQHAKASDDLPRGVAVGLNESVSIMVNEEDHLRVQVLRSGMQLGEAFEQINRIDDCLEKRLDFAFSQKYGYLTACPTNIGTGIRVSVMMHLPALKLTGEIDKVKRAAKDMHLAVRGMFGEGSDAIGDLFQISNQTTLGRGEQEILADFQHTVVPQIIAYEQQARQALVRQRPALLDDGIWRSWAILNNARLMRTDEVLSLLSQIRLGVTMGRLEKVSMRTLNELFLMTQPAHLQKLMGSDMDPAQRREARATLIRKRLGQA